MYHHLKGEYSMSKKKRLHFIPTLSSVMQARRMEIGGGQR
jgi:hypothetical protein